MVVSACIPGTPKTETDHNSRLAWCSKFQASHSYTERYQLKQGEEWGKLTSEYNFCRMTICKCFGQKLFEGNTDFLFHWLIFLSQWGAPVTFMLTFVMLVLLAYQVESNVSQSFYSQIRSLFLFLSYKSVIFFPLLCDFVFFCHTSEEHQQTVNPVKAGGCPLRPCHKKSHRGSGFSWVRLSKCSGLSSRWRAGSVLGQVTLYITDLYSSLLV